MIRKQRVVLHSQNLHFNVHIVTEAYNFKADEINIKCG